MVGAEVQPSPELALGSTCWKSLELHRGSQPFLWNGTGDHGHFWTKRGRVPIPGLPGLSLTLVLFSSFPAPEHISRWDPGP